MKLVKKTILRYSEPMTWETYCKDTYGKVPPNSSDKVDGHILYSGMPGDKEKSTEWVSDFEFKQQWKEVK